MNALLKFPTAPQTKTVFNGLFDELFDRNIAQFIGSDLSPLRPAVNILETDDNFKIEMAAPGFEKSNFSVNIDGDQLTVSGEKTVKNEELDEKNEKFTRREFHYSTFKRSFTLPKSVNHDAVQAVYENGILNLTIPKKEESKKVSKTIAIA